MMEGTSVATFSSPTALRVRWSASEFGHPTLTQISRQFELLEAALSASLAVENPRTLIFSPLFLEAIDVLLSWIFEETKRSEVCLSLIREEEFEQPKEESDRRQAIEALKLESSTQDVARSTVAAFGRVARLGSPLAGTLVESLLKAAESSERANQELETALDLMMQREPDLDSADPNFKAQQEARDVISSSGRMAQDADRAAIQVLAPSEPSTKVHVVRMRQESPIEMVIALVGGASAAVALCSHLLDVRQKYRTRDEREDAERAGLLRQLAEDEIARARLEQLRSSLNRRKSSEMTIDEIVSYDTVEEALEDFDEGSEAWG